LLFHTLEFAVLLAVAWPAYLLIRHPKGQNYLLLVASYVFYGWWEWRYIPLLLFSTVVDYLIGRALDSTGNTARRRVLVTLSCVANLGLLGFFKYWDFFASTSNGIARFLGLEEVLPELHILLPIGISFYTFQSMAYTIDVYRGQFPAWKSFVQFAAYISFFPQLIAGPIERPDNLLRAVASSRRVTWNGVEECAFLFAQGWLLKSLGDVLGEIVDPIFADPAEQGAWGLLWGMYCFTFQVYCDFFGYSQMARGLGRLFGFRLMENFRAPFFAPNVRELWARWHISLTSWLRDYLFFPLGGLRGRRFRVVRNLVVTFFLSGLWHGASWTFVVWGVSLGAAIAVYHLTLDPSVPARRRYLRQRAFLRRSWTALGTLVSFNLFALTIVLFRSQETASASAWGNAVHYYTGLLSLMKASWETPPIAMWVIAIPILSDLLQLREGNSYWSRGWPWPVRGMVIAVLFGAAFVFGSGRTEAFIYFQF
jgi:D-alanyl-lipoteichoic acid acyltransferase DltB (MBOAT superfamily)